MALYERVESLPVLGIDEGGQIVIAAAVLGRAMALGKALIHVGTWEAGRGPSETYLQPAEFESWRRSFAKPEHEA